MVGYLWVHWVESLECWYPALASSVQFWRMISARHRLVSLQPSSASRSGDATSGLPFQYAVGTRSAHFVALAPTLMLLNSRLHGSMFVSGLHRPFLFFLLKGPVLF